MKLMELTELINEYYNELGVIEKSMCQFILEHVGDVRNMSVEEFAKKNLSSKSTVIRFSQKLGFTGFGELKHFIKWQSEKATTNYECYCFLEQVLRDTQKTVQYLHNQDWSKLYTRIQLAEHVYVISTGITQQIQASELQRLFMLSGKDVRIIPGNKKVVEFQRAYEMLTNKDIIIVLSLSGENIDLEEVIHLAKQKKVGLISVTNYQSNWLSKNCDYHLYAWSSRGPAPKQWWLRTTCTFFVIIEAFVFGYNDFLHKVSEDRIREDDK